MPKFPILLVTPENPPVRDAPETIAVVLYELRALGARRAFAFDVSSYARYHDSLGTTFFSKVQK